MLTRMGYNVTSVKPGTTVFLSRDFSHFFEEQEFVCCRPQDEQQLKPSM